MDAQEFLALPLTIGAVVQVLYFLGLFWACLWVMFGFLALIGLQARVVVACIVRAYYGTAVSIWSTLVVNAATLEDMMVRVIAGGLILAFIGGLLSLFGSILFNAVTRYRKRKREEARGLAA